MWRVNLNDPYFQVHQMDKNEPKLCFGSILPIYKILIEFERKKSLLILGKVYLNLFLSKIEKDILYYKAGKLIRCQESTQDNNK